MESSDERRERLLTFQAIPNPSLDGFGSPWCAMPPDQRDELYDYVRGLDAAREEAGRVAKKAGWVDALRRELETARGVNVTLRARVEELSEAWRWVGDGTDCLGTMANGMQVMIRAGVLRELIAKPPTDTGEER